MSSPKTTAAIALIALLAIGVVCYQTVALRQARGELATASGRLDDLAAKQTGLQQRLQAAERRAEAAAQDRAALVKVVQSSVAASAPAKVVAGPPLSSAAVLARFQQARELAKSGQFEAALREFLWCYDIGMKGVSGLGPVRLTMLSEVGKLGEQYPEALIALRTRRDQIEARALASDSDYDAISEFSALNRALGENERNMELYDQLPQGDRRRRSLASASYDSLVTSQRYTAALEGRPYASLSSLFELSSQERPEMAQRPNAEELRKSMHDGTVKSTAESIEVLAGAGDLVHARMLADRLLAYDGTEATKAEVQKHAERAGHPELMTALAKP